MAAKHHWEIVNAGGVITATDAQGLWDNACNYFKFCDENPIEVGKQVQVGKDAGKDLTVKKTRPYTVKGLCLHCGIIEEYLRDTRQSKNKDDMYYIVISRILMIIAVQNMELGMIGEYNSIMVQKILNIGVDDVPVSAVKVEIVGNLPPLARSENDILETLESQNLI